MCPHNRQLTTDKITVLITISIFLPLVETIEINAVCTTFVAAL